MSTIDTLFRDLRKTGRKAFMPFVTAGDPDLEFTAALIRLLVERGSSLCEVGIPYSDPIADGPVIQASYTRALDHKVKLAEILKMLGAVTPEVAAPVVTMVSYAIVYRHGLEAYVTDAKRSGVAGLSVDFGKHVPDVRQPEGPVQVLAVSDNPRQTRLSHE